MSFTPPPQSFASALPVLPNVAIAFQAGAALGAQSAGTAAALLNSGTLNVISTTGTSSGLSSAAFMAEGILTGGNSQGARRLQECWWGMMRSHDEQLRAMAGHPVLHDMMRYWQQLMQVKPLQLPPISPLHVMLQETYNLSHSLARSGLSAWRHASGNALYDYYEEQNNLRPLLTRHPVSAFLQSMEDAGQGLDLATIAVGGERLLLAGNATSVIAGSSRYDATSSTEVVASNNQRVCGTLPITGEFIAASGSLYSIMPEVTIDRQTLREGAHCSNPYWQGLLPHCAAHDGVLVVLRSRPAEHDPRSWQTQQLAAKGRDFNAKTDRQLRDLAPDQPVCVVDPVDLSGLSDGAPEFDFTRATIDARWAAGYRTGERMIATGAIEQAKNAARPLSNFVPAARSLNLNVALVA